MSILLSPLVELRIVNLMSNCVIYTQNQMKNVHSRSSTVATKRFQFKWSCILFTTAGKRYSPANGNGEERSQSSSHHEYQETISTFKCILFTTAGKVFTGK